MTHAALAPWTTPLALLALFAPPEESGAVFLARGQAPAALPERYVEVVLAVEGMV